MASTRKRTSKTARAHKPPKLAPQSHVPQLNRKPAGTAVESKPGAQVVTQAAIAEAAYFLWLERGGSELSNWLEAEAMLSGRLPRLRA